MAKVLLINPVVRMEDNPKHVPYGIALLAAIADAEGHQVQIFDANAWRPDDQTLREVLEADSWDLIGVGGISTTYGYIKKIVKMAVQAAPQALRVVGGGVLTSIPQDIMRLLPEIDIGVVGEAFINFPEMLRRIDTGEKDWSQVKGLIWRDSEGRAHLNPPVELIPDLDVLPYPAWDMLPLDIYFANSALLYSEEAFNSRRRLDINGSFGCPFICRFCFHLGLAGDLQYEDTANDRADVVFTHDRTNRWHSPRYIVQMAKYMHQKYGVDFLLFYDENLLAINSSAKNKWLPEICRLWIEEGLQPTCSRLGVPHDEKICKDGVHWGGTSHASLANPTLLKQMREAGCSQLLYGYESFSSRILKNVGKGATPETNERSLKLTLEAGIRPIPNQMMGFPDEFFDSLIDCVEAWDRMGIQVKPFFATAYPGTEWYNKYKDNILAQYDGDLDAFLLDLGDATKITATICENFNAVDLLGLRELMVNRDIKRIREYEKVWRSVHGEPKFSDVRWPQAERRQKVPVLI
ncbi:MAG: B12-binding domain-containing radical SAM protein [Elusimicrobia bacterium]|nr:B12-binding domain-containing radical SAM protein [Elusimicrobiota bacterium]